MTYTEQQKQALSRKVAEKFGIEAHRPESGTCRRCFEETQDIWLHDDWHTIMELCVKHGVEATHSHGLASATKDSSSNWEEWIDVPYTDCASPSEAERIARLMALGELCGS